MSLSLASRKDFIEKIRNYIPKYTDDTSTVNSNINKDLLFSDASLYNYLASKSLCEPSQLSQYRKYLDITDNCPFDTQEEIAIDILNFFNIRTKGIIYPIIRHFKAIILFRVMRCSYHYTFS